MIKYDYIRIENRNQLRRKQIGKNTDGQHQQALENVRTDDHPFTIALIHDTAAER